MQPRGYAGPGYIPPAQQMAPPGPQQMAPPPSRWCLLPADGASSQQMAPPPQQMAPPPSRWCLLPADGASSQQMAPPPSRWCLLPADGASSQQMVPPPNQQQPRYQQPPQQHYAMQASAGVSQGYSIGANSNIGASIGNEKVNAAPTMPKLAPPPQQYNVSPPSMPPPPTAGLAQEPQPQVLYQLLLLLARTLCPAIKIHFTEI